MSHYVNKYGDDWDKFVNYALMAHCAVPHSITRYSPSYPLYGREMRLPAEDDLTPEKFVTKDGASCQESIQHHLETLADRLNEAYQVVRENNKMGQERQKKYYNQGTKLVTFQLGYMVYLKDIMNSTKKCAKFWIGWKRPYKVIQRLSDLNYLVQLSRTKEIVVMWIRLRSVFDKPPCDRQLSHRGETTGQRTNLRLQKCMGQDTLDQTHKPPFQMLLWPKTTLTSNLITTHKHELPTVKLPKYRRVEVNHQHTL